jgi:photosystem II stability/assembly factor-like uncharacterized protein
MNDRLLVATRKGLFTVERTGSRGSPWSITRTDFLGDNLSIVLQDPRDGSVYAGLDHGHFGVKLHRAKGIGEAWEECGVPAYPKQPEGETDVDTMGRTIPWNTVKLWALETGGPDEPGVLWCGTLPGGLFRSRDGGTSWEMMRSLWDEPKRKSWFGGGYDVPGIHSVCVDPRSSRTVRIAVSCGGVWTTHDGGETWTCEYEGMTASYLPPENDVPHVQDPHRLVQCAAQPDALWVQHHDAIFRSTDGGARWQKITNAGPSCFGFAVAVHPKEADTAWFVPAIKDERRIPADGKLVVTRTRDGGKTFDVLHKGLPQAHAYDLAYRHGLDISADGNRLALGSTTGGLWISEDQGDSWIGVSQNLPPIHCVRFASA